MTGLKSAFRALASIFRFIHSSHYQIVYFAVGKGHPAFKSQLVSAVRVVQGRGCPHSIDLHDIKAIAAGIVLFARFKKRRIAPWARMVFITYKGRQRTDNRSLVISLYIEMLLHSSSSQ